MFALRGKQDFKRHRPNCSQMLCFVVFGRQDPLNMTNLKSQPTWPFGPQNCTVSKSKCQYDDEWHLFRASSISRLCHLVGTCAPKQSGIATPSSTSIGEGQKGMGKGRVRKSHDGQIPFSSTQCCQRNPPPCLHLTVGSWFGQKAVFTVG